MDTSFYCIAKGRLEGTVPGAKVLFPSPINLSKSKYEVALVYCSFIPKWDTLDDLYMIYAPDEGERQSILFDEIFCGSSEAAISEMSSQLEERFGVDFRENRCLIVLDQKDGVYRLSLRKRSSLFLSPQLANILGLPTVLRNETEKKKRYIITPNKYLRYIDDDFYYITSDQVKENCISDILPPIGILSFVHLTDASKKTYVSHYPPTLQYFELKEANLLQEFTIEVLKNDGTQIFDPLPQFIALLHFRKVH